jgi:ribonuclease P protein component
LGIVVKKEIGPATFRNKIRRYVREFFRLHKHQIKSSYDMILMIKKGCSINRYQQAEEELRGLLILWKRERPTRLPKKDLSFSFISIDIRFPPSSGPAVVLLLPVPLMLCYRFNDLESWRDPCCRLRDS